MGRLRLREQLRLRGICGLWERLGLREELRLRGIRGFRGDLDLGRNL